MPIIYGDNPISSFAALMPYANFAQKRLDADRNLAYMQQLSGIEKNRVDGIRQAQAEIEDAALKLNSLPVRPEDANRLKELVDSTISNELKGLRESGNPEAWLRLNLGSVGTRLSRNVIKSPEFSNMGENKINMAKYEDDKAHGRFTMDMEVTMKDGSTKLVPALEAEKMYRNGDAVRIRHNDSFDLPDVAEAFKFFSTNKNPLGLKAGNQVTYDQFYLKIFDAPQYDNIPLSEKEKIAEPLYSKYKNGLKWNNTDLQYKYSALAQDERQNLRAYRAKQSSGTANDQFNLYNSQVYSIADGNLNAIDEHNKNNPNNQIFNTDITSMNTDAGVAARLLTKNNSASIGDLGVSIDQKVGMYIFDRNTGTYIPQVRTINDTDLVDFKPNGKMGLKMGVRGGADNVVFGGTTYIKATDKQDAINKLKLSFDYMDKEDKTRDRVLTEDELSDRYGINISDNPIRIEKDIVVGTGKDKKELKYFAVDGIGAADQLHDPNTMEFNRKTQIVGKNLTDRALK